MNLENNKKTLFFVDFKKTLVLDTCALPINLNKSSEDDFFNKPLFKNYLTKFKNKAITPFTFSELLNSKEKEQNQVYVKILHPNYK